MTVRFVIGRAGSGKTHRCLAAVRRRLRDDPVHGPRLILLVPEQASLQMERAIFASTHDTDDPDGCTIGGSHRAEVLSFQRLARRVLDAVGAPQRVALTESARAMVLRLLVARLGNRLRYYGRVARPGRSGWRAGGFIGRLSATVSELIEEAIDPTELEPREASGYVGEPYSDPAQAAKLHDIHLIYAAYLDYLGAERIDPSQHLQLATARLHHCAWLVGAEMWVDGFASLSGQETATLVELARLASQTEITALIDPALLDGQANPADHLFARPLRLFHDLARTFRAAGLEVEDPVMLVPSTPPRYQASPTLARIERNLFRRATMGGDDVGPPPRDVELIELPSQRIEVDYAVSRIVRWACDPDSGLRYRDLAIIVRDLEPYHDLISAALEARGIPFFIDRRRPVAHHPLVELLRAACLLATENLSLESIRLTLKTGLLPVSIEAADELENYIIAQAIAGVDKWREGDWAFAGRSNVLRDEDDDAVDPVEAASLVRINATRRLLLEFFDEWLNCCGGTTARSGSEWASATTALLDRLRVGEALRGWSESAERDGDLNQADEHRRVREDVSSILDDIAFAFSDAPLSIDEYADVLEVGLSQMTLGLVPPTIDQVLVGSIDRSRHPDIQAAVVLGFNDGVFPREIEEDSILNDDDRIRLQASGVRIGPAVRDRVVDESLLVYIAVTRPSRSLVITWATSNHRGRSMRQSPYVDAITKACPGLVVAVVPDPARARAMGGALDGGDLALCLAREFRSRPVIDRDDSAIRGRWNALYELTRNRLRADDSGRRAMSGLGDPRAVRVSPQKMQLLVGGTLKTSVSRLESYAACPFQYLAKYGLGLSERLEAPLQPLDVGQVHHAVLEEFMRSLAAEQRSLADLGDGEMMTRLEDSCDRVARRIDKGGFLSDARNAYQLRRSAEQLARILRAQRYAARAGRFRPRAVELPFGFDKPNSLPPLELDTPAGRKVLLRGYIDRVDLAELGDDLLGAVVDYKWSRDRKLDLQQVYHGLSLQLVGYLLALAEHGQTLTGRRVRPIGALYVNLAPRYELVDRPIRSDDIDDRPSDVARPRGLIRDDGFAALDSTLETGRSSVYSFFKLKDGSLGHLDASDGARGAEFDAILAHTRERMGELADGIIDGAFPVRPYRLGTSSPCSWCSMASVCRFETGLCDVRFLDKLKRSEVLARVTARADLSPSPGP